MTHLATRPQSAAAESLERYLGDPGHADAFFNHRRALDIDEREVFPGDVLGHVMDWGFHEYAIPVDLGGRQRSLEELYYMIRSITRRDMTIAHILGASFLGAVCPWIAGSAEQRTRLAAMMRARGLCCLALTEKEHGSDMMASEVVARPVDGGYELSGTKWLINNASRSQAITLFAMVPGAETAVHTLFLIEKTQLDPERFGYLDKITTLGVRGLDLRGITFDRAFIPASCVLGRVGSGTSLLMRGLYVTRALCPALSLGATDTGLRTVLRFARGRQLYGDSVFAIPEAQRQLVEAFVDMLICDCVGTATSRILHAAPDQASLSSAVAKYQVPTTCEQILSVLSVVLGARFYVRNEHPWSIFQKMLRDAQVVSLFDGSTAVNLYILGGQLASIAARRQREQDVDRAQAARNLFDLAQPLVPFAPQRLMLSSGGRDLVVQNLPAAHAMLEAAHDLPADLRDVLGAQVTALRQALDAHGAACADSPLEQRSNQLRSPAHFDLARDYCAIHAAAVTLQLWLYNRSSLHGFLARGRWVAIALGRQLARLDHPGPSIPQAFYDEVAEGLVELEAQNRMFSLLAIPLGVGAGANPAAGASADVST